MYHVHSNSGVGDFGIVEFVVVRILTSRRSEFETVESESESESESETGGVTG